MFTTPTRNHISIIVERLGAVLLVFVVLVYNLITQNGTDIFTRSYWHELLKQASGMDGLKMLFFSVVPFVVIITSLLVSLLHWRKTFFYISGGEFIFERRTMFKKESKLPVANIATVNVEQNIFERLLGTAKVKLDLNSSLTADKTDFVFVLKFNEAQALKSELTRIKKGDAEKSDEAQVLSSRATNDVEEISGSEVASFDFSRSVKQSLLSFPFIQLAITVLLLYIVPLAAHESMNGVNFLAAFTLLGALWRSAMRAINYAEYKTFMDEKNIYINCGLLKKRSYTFERAKINAVIVHQPLLARLLKLSFTSLAVVGLGNEKNEDIYLSLVLPKSETDKILSDCAPDFNCTGEKIPASRAQLISGMLTAVLLTAISIIAPLAGVKYGLAICLAVFAVSMAAAFCASKTKSICADENVLCFSSGVFNKRTVCFKYGDIQTCRISTNLLMKKLGAARLTVSILSSSKLKLHKSGWFDLELLEAAANRMVSHGDNVAKMIKH